MFIYFNKMYDFIKSYIYPHKYKYLFSNFFIYSFSFPLIYWQFWQDQSSIHL